jgi:hypothetical protein
MPRGHIFAFYSPFHSPPRYAPPMPHPTLIRTSVVACKKCSRNIPSRTDGVPSQPIIIRCPICDERRHYLPSEVFQGSPSYEVRKVEASQ